MTTFPLWQIALAAVVAFLASLLALFLIGQSFSTFSKREEVFIALIVGFSLLAWRTASNVGVLNNDPIPAISPNDALCPLFAYVFLSLYAAFRHPKNTIYWERTRAILTALAFLTSVIVL